MNTRALEHHAPDGETHVVERDQDGQIVGVSEALPCRDYMDDECQYVRPEFDPWDTEIEADERYDAEDRADPDNATFLAGFN